MRDILFINSTPHQKLREEVNGTMILATKLIDAGFDVDVLRFYQIDSYNSADYYTFIEDITNRILSSSPRCVSFYTLWPYYHIMLRISQRLKEKNPHIITVLGGPQSSATAYETMKAMPFIDYIATGEGENTVVPFFTSLLRNDRRDIENIPGLYYRKNNRIEFCHKALTLCDINEVPRWHERFYETSETNLNSKKYGMPIDVGRGCPFRCTFCSSSTFWKRAYRLKAPEKILDDILFYYKKFGIVDFSFSHDAFTMNKQLVSDVCDRIIESGLAITWKCTTRADCLTEELILKMKQAGMNIVELGVETGSPSMQKTIEKRLDLEKVKQTVRFLMKNNILVRLYFMYGFPEETEEDLNQTLNMYCDFAEMGVHDIHMSYCKFNPSTIITKHCFEELVFDPKINIISRDIFGYDEEKQLFKDNKSIFPFFYHLNTPVRNQYQYLMYFAALYRKFSRCLCLVRAHYNGDLLQFYRDFYESNREIFNSDINTIQKNVKENGRELLLNTVSRCNATILERFASLLDFYIDLQQITKSGTDKSLQKIYDFSYIEHQLQLPIEQFSDSSCELLIEKKNGAVSVQIISI